jgi:hypothetical protein
MAIWSTISEEYIQDMKLIRHGSIHRSEYKMYSQTERAKPCSQCNANGVQTLIQWRENPEKKGMINQKTGRAYMKPWDVNKNDWHVCQFYNPPQPGTSTNYGVNATTKPPFTPNDKTGENILKRLDDIVKQNEQMIMFLQVIAEKSIKQGITPAGDLMPPEHKDYQNNTGYAEDDKPSDIGVNSSW